MIRKVANGAVPLAGMVGDSCVLFAIEVLSWNEDVDAAEWKLFGDRRDIKCRELLHMQLGNISTSLCSKMRL